MGETRTFEICPNFKKHCDEGARWQKGISPYKRDTLAAMHRQGFGSSQRTCDWCNPPCPTCGTRFRRSAEWLAKVAKATRRKVAR